MVSEKDASHTGQLFVKKEVITDESERGESQEPETEMPQLTAAESTAIQMPNITQEVDTDTADSSQSGVDTIRDALNRMAEGNGNAEEGASTTTVSSNTPGNGEVGAEETLGANSAPEVFVPKLHKQRAPVVNPYTGTLAVNPKLCFYCEVMKPNRECVPLPNDAHERKGWFYALSKQNQEMTAVMEMFHLRAPINVYICRSHFEEGAGTIAYVIKPDPQAIAKWNERMEWDKAGQMMTKETAIEMGFTQRVCSLMCCYCRKNGKYWQSLMNERYTLRWIKTLAMGHEKVEEFIRLDIKSRSRNVICTSHFLRSSFVSYTDPNGAHVVKLRIGETPVPDPAIVQELLDRIESVKVQEIFEQPATAIAPPPAEVPALPFHIDGQEKLTADQKPDFDPIPITTWHRLGRGIGGRGLSMRPDQFLWWSVSPEGFLVTHRFLEALRGNGEFICMSCKEVVREIDNAYLANQKAWKREYARNYPYKTMIRTPYASWMRDNKEWLKTKFTYKVHEFSTKAKKIWDEEDPAVRKKYYDVWYEAKRKVEEEKLLHNKEMDLLENVRPQHQGIPPATVMVKDKKALADIDSLVHVCMLVGRPWTEDHINSEGKYDPPLLTFKMYPGSEDFLRSMTRLKQGTGPRARKNRIMQEQEEFVIYDEESGGVIETEEPEDAPTPPPAKKKRGRKSAAAPDPQFTCKEETAAEPQCSSGSTEDKKTPRPSRRSKSNAAAFMKVEQEWEMEDTGMEA